MAYPETAALLIDLISQKLQDTGNATWTDAEILLYFPEMLRKISQYAPHIRMLEFLIESRRGTASETSSGFLVDDVADQFVAGDVGKIAYNVTDRTWAYIKTHTDATKIGVGNDIFADGEAYRIFNKNCNHQKEIYIGELTDWLWIDKIEFPAMEDPPRLVKWIERGRDVIRLDIDEEPDDSSVATAKKQVWVFFALRHKISQLTTLTAKSVAAVVGATTMDVTNAQASATIEMGQEFTIANERARGIYMLTANATTEADQTATINFWPPLESSVDTNEVITFIPSTLTPRLEGIFTDLVVGKAIMSKAPKYLNQINKGGARVHTDTYLMGKAIYDGAEEELESLRGFEAPSICLP
ncbi:hypothetical protein LCGC14_1941990 [marine sediment metagenome]|uniref:Uncharacterized protein n=1 Tax=marine sediment metagenome TaxID=412755 RepID=A0A0F9FKA3_9ZZZZ